MADLDQEHWKKLVADFEACDLTQREFASERGIGKLVVDGYSGYNKVTLPGGRERAGCLAHRRVAPAQLESTTTRAVGLKQAGGAPRPQQERRGLVGSSDSW